MAVLFHYTNKAGWNGIRSAPTWRFRAAKPPDARPHGAYFTNVRPDDPYLARKLGIPRRKLEYVFRFRDVGGLEGTARRARPARVPLSRGLPRGPVSAARTRTDRTMIIGGTDIILENFVLSGGAALEAIARFAHDRWPNAVFVDADTGHRFASFAATAFGTLRELLVFRDEETRARWEREGYTEGADDDSLYVLLDGASLTLVVMDPDARDTHVIVEEAAQLLSHGWAESEAA